MRLGWQSAPCGTSLLDKEGGVNCSLEFYEYVTDHLGRPLNAAEAYDPDDNSINIFTGTESFGLTRDGWGLNEQEAIALLAAHSTVHKVQVNKRGLVGSTIRAANVGLENYAASEPEKEAWNESVGYFMKRFPGGRGQLRSGGIIDFHGTKIKIP